MVSFRFLHISDLHFNSISRRSVPFLSEINEREALLKRVINTAPRHLKSKIKNLLVHSHNGDVADSLARFVYYYKSVFDAELDFILATGDLATTGEVPDLELAFKYINGPISYLWRQADNKSSLATVKDVALLPGNHDRFRNIGYFPGSREFDNIFSSYWSATNGVHIFKFPKGGVTLGIILIDFSLPSVSLNAIGRGVWGKGAARESTLAVLEAKTKLLKEEGCPVIWAMHFEPNNFIGHLGLANADKVIKLADELDVHHIFCGHLHRRIQSRMKKTSVNIYCVGSATELNKKNDNSVNTVRIDAGGGNIQDVNVQEHLYHLKSRLFQ